MMVRGVWIACFLLVCCGGGSAEPKTAENEPSEDLGFDTETEAAPEAGELEEGAEQSEEPESGSGTATPEDVRKVLQLVIDDEEVTRHLKLTEPGRFPLKIAGSVLPGGVELTKGTEPVEIVDSPDSSEEAVLVFTKLDVDGNRARVSFRYDVEGVRGSASLAKGEFGWEIVNTRVVERHR